MSFDFSTASDSPTNPLNYFSDRGEYHEKCRPIHPASAINTILSGLGSPTQLVAADVGAGTGIGVKQANKPVANNSSLITMIQATIKKVCFCIFCLFLLTVACTSKNSSNREDNQDSQTNAPREDITFKTNNENKLRDQIEQISHAAQGYVGVTATVLETGESVTLNGDQRFPMQSVYKFDSRADDATREAVIAKVAQAAWDEWSR